MCSGLQILSKTALPVVILDCSSVSPVFVRLVFLLILVLVLMSSCRWVTYRFSCKTSTSASQLLMLILLSVFVVVCSLSWSFALCLGLQTSSRWSQFKTPKYCQDFDPRSIWCFHGAVHVTRDNEGCYRSLDLCGAQSQCMLGSITYVAQTKSPAQKIAFVGF